MKFLNLTSRLSISKICHIMLLPLVALVFTVACEKAPSNNDLAKELKKRLPSEISNMTVSEVTPLMDQKGIAVTLTVDPKHEKDPIFASKTSLENMYPTVAKTTFCNNKSVKYHLSRYINDTNYVIIIINNSKKQELFNYKVTKELCKTNDSGYYNVSKAHEKQEEQGFYDEDYLNHVYIPLMQKNLPTKLTTDLTITKITAGPGSRLSIYLDYTPKSEPKEISIEKLNAVLQSIYSKSCKDPDTRKLISMVKVTTWFGLINGEQATNLTASRTCK